MRILLLGGTAFLGRHLVEAALTQGHEVTLFNRGRTNADLYPNVEQLRGDRDGHLDVLRGRTWDAVIDTSGYVPRVVRQSVQLLKGAAPFYAFVSSISVYADFSQVGMDETAAVAVLTDEKSEDVRAHYGALKALCEQEVLTGFGAGALIVRPGLIVGPHDPTGRFTYWPRRFAEGGEVLVPGRREFPIQFIDVRDLAEWMIRMVAAKTGGVFNATGPRDVLTMEKFVQTLTRVVPEAGQPTWVDEDLLLANGVREFEELPLWISDETNWPGFMTTNIQKAVHEGLRFRPIADTILDTLAWDNSTKSESDASRPQGTGKAGMNREREKDLLLRWKMQNREQT